jgi:hypothetical protein
MIRREGIRWRPKSRHCSPEGPGISISPDRHGSGANRIEADLSIKQRREILMRRASTCLAVLGLAVLGLPSAASATPTITFKFTAIPIPGFPHTGNIRGAGTAARLEWTIKGTEYDAANGVGHPWPLIGVNVFFPKGSKLSPAGFPTCSRKAVEEKGEPVFGTSACPLKSLITFPVKAPQPIEPGTACTTVLPNESYGLGVVQLGKGEVTCEKARVTGWIAPGGKLEFLADGVTPALFEKISVGTVTNGSTPKTTTVVPLIEPIRGAAFASTEKIIVYAGSAIKKGKKTTYYGNVPKTCPKGGFPVKTELIFAENGEADPATLIATKPVSVSKEYKAPCPRK